MTVHASASAEVRAIQRHFTAVLACLHHHEPTGLGPAQRAVRELLVDALAVYAQRGLFPKNVHFPNERRPSFVDDEGTRCAVAHLMELSGEGELAQSIRDRMNFASVPEIASADPRVLSWLVAAGFTPEELALIQPSYCHVTAAECMCHGARPLVDGSVLATVAIVAPGVGRVSSIEVGSAPGIDVGTSVDVPIADVGREWVARIEVGDAGVVSKGNRHEVSGNSVVPCTSWGVTGFAISKQELAEAVLSADPFACAGYLKTLNPEWVKSAAERNLPESPRCTSTTAVANSYDTRGCATTSVDGSPLQSLALLGALVGALAVRKRPSTAS